MGSENERPLIAAPRRNDLLILGRLRPDAGAHETAGRCAHRDADGERNPAASSPLVTAGRTLFRTEVIQCYKFKVTVSEGCTVS